MNWQQKQQFSPARATWMVILAAWTIILAASMIVGGVLSVLGSTDPLSFALGALAIPAGVNCLYFLVWLGK